MGWRQREEVGAGGGGREEWRREEIYKLLFRKPELITIFLTFAFHCSCCWFCLICTIFVSALEFEQPLHKCRFIIRHIINTCIHTSFPAAMLLHIHTVQHTLTPGSCLGLYNLSLLLLATEQLQRGRQGSPRVLLKGTLAVAMYRKECVHLQVQINYWIYI